MRIGIPTERPITRGRFTFVYGSTPLLTTLEEATVKPPREELTSPEESVLVEETTVVSEIVGGVAKPSKPTEPNLMVEKVIASTLSLLMPSRVNIWLTIRSILVKTASKVFALSLMLKPTLRLLWHFQPFFVNPLTQDVQ